MNGFEKVHERILSWTDAGQWQDGEEIVRCRDCNHYHEAGIASYTPFCELMNDSDVTPDGFCAWGVREMEVS